MACSAINEISNVCIRHHTRSRACVDTTANGVPSEGASEGIFLI